MKSTTAISVLVCILISTGFIPNGVTGRKCKCGIKGTKQTHFRIMGGKTTDVNEYPWQVSFSLLEKNHYEGHLCGGSLINDQWILSAAHCFEDYPRNIPRIWRVVLGDHDLSRTYDAEHVDFRISHIINHPNYDTHNINFDFALVRLEKKVSFSSHIRPICLPKNDRYTYEGKAAIASGWGRMNNTYQIYSTTLREVNLKVLSNKDCVIKFKHQPHEITEQMLCAFGNGVKDTCDADSGGPLITRIGRGKRSHYELIGVSSYVGSVRCADKELPGVFARVSKQLKWISKNTKGSRTCLS